MRELDGKVRLHIYDQFVRSGLSPTKVEVARALDEPLMAVENAYERLDQEKALVLQNSSREVLMAEPFSAVPTSFLVKIGNRTWWANCIWDALGVPAMLSDNAEIITTCGDCGELMRVTVENGSLKEAAGIVHFAIPARDWWKDVVFT